MKFKEKDPIRLKTDKARVGEVIWQSGKVVRVRWPDGVEEGLFEKDLEAVPAVEGELPFTPYNLCAERGVIGPYDAEVLVGRLYKLVWRTLTGDITHVELVHLDGSYVTTIATSRRGGVLPQQVELCLVREQLALHPELALEHMAPTAHQEVQQAEEVAGEPEGN